MSRTLIGTLTLATLTVAAAPASSQATDAKLGVLTRLVGAWQGEAWYQMGPGERQTARQHEWVELVAGGTAVAVKGLGTMTTADGGTRTVHDAFAVIHRNHENTGIMMRAFTAQGHWLDPEIELTEKGYTWRMTDPRAGAIRYDMVIDDQGRWVEKGFRQAGTEWVQFMEMVLTRK